MADTQLDATLSASEPISGNLSANEGINASLAPDEEVSGSLEVKRTRTVATMLSELEDVEIDDLQDDDILVYDSLDGKWHNEANAGGGGVWGTITGTLSDQADLQAVLDEKYGTNDTAETDIADADYIPFYDTSASAKRKSLWSNIKAKLNEIFFRRSENNVLGAKNLLPNNAVSTEYNGIIYTVNADGTVTANGSTSSSSSNLKLCELSLTAGDKYIVSGGYNNKVRINIYLKSNPSTEILVTNTDYIWTVPATGVYAVQIYVNTNSTVTDAVISPMMRFDTDPDDTYVPYALTNKQLTDVVGQNVSDIDAIEELIPSGASSSNKLATANDIPSLSNYVEKSFTEGLLKNDGTVDTTQYVSDVSGKADKVSGATSGDFAGLDANGNLADSGISADIVPSGASSSNKLATVNDIPSLTNYVEKSQTAGLLKNDGTVDTTQYVSDISGKVDNSVVAPVESGATASQAYAIGEHFIKDGAFCTAKAAIASGATFTLDTNYTEGSIADAVVQSNWSYTTSGLTPTNCTILGGGYCKIGNLVIVNMRIKFTSTSGVTITGFPAYGNKTSNTYPLEFVSYLIGATDLMQYILAYNGTMSAYKGTGSTSIQDKDGRFSFMYLCN